MSVACPEIEAPQSFEQLNRRFRPGLMMFFLRRLGNHAEAEDMIQEVFVRLAALDGKQVQSQEAYIFRMAVNLLRDHSRREKVRYNYRAQSLASEEAGIDVIDPLRVVAAQESMEDLTEALRELPELTRDIFVLYRIENVDKREIAQTFNISLSTLERHLTRAMVHLTKSIKEDA